MQSRPSTTGSQKSKRAKGEDSSIDLVESDLLPSSCARSNDVVQRQTTLAPSSPPAASQGSTIGNLTSSSLKAQLDAVRRPGVRQASIRKAKMQPQPQPQRRAVSSSFTPRKQGHQRERTVPVATVSSSPLKSSTRGVQASEGAAPLQTTPKPTPPKRTPSKLRLRRSSSVVKVNKSPAAQTTTPRNSPAGGDVQDKSRRADSEPADATSGM